MNDFFFKSSYIKGKFSDKFEEIFLHPYIYACSSVVLNKMSFLCKKGVNVEFASPRQQ